jgi:serine protease Do
MTITDKDVTHAHTDLVSDFTAVAERLRRATVQIHGLGPGVGSGVIWRESGLIITNAHVARAARARVRLWDGRALDATVIRRDPPRDLAALKVEANGLPAATMGDSSALRVGELVLAVGNPLGLVGALTMGIIHTNEPDQQKWVQADVRLAPGNSGGPLANARGQVIGVNSMVAWGLALAVPSNAVERFLSGPHKRPYLGVTLQPVRVPLSNQRVFGLLVLEVEPGSLAEKAGLLAGDVLIGAGGQSFKTLGDLAVALSTTGFGAVLLLDLVRGGQRMACDVVLSAEAEAVEVS